MNDTQYKTILNEVRGVSEDIARLDRDNTKDAQKVADVLVIVKDLVSRLEAVEKAVFRQSDKIQDKVADAIEETTEPLKKEVKGLTDILEDKKKGFFGKLWKK